MTTGRREFIKTAAGVAGVVATGSAKVNDFVFSSSGALSNAQVDSSPDLPLRCEVDKFCDQIHGHEKVRECIEWLDYQEQHVENMMANTVLALYFLPEFLSRYLGRRKGRLYVKYNKPEAAEWEWETATRFMEIRTSLNQTAKSVVTEENYKSVLHHYEFLYKKVFGS